VILLIILLGPVSTIPLVLILIFLLDKLRDYDPRYRKNPRPKYNAKYHHFSTNAIQNGKDSYQKIIQQYKDHPNQEVVIQCASNIEECIKVGSMFTEAQLWDADREAKKSFFYWRAWAIQFQDRAIAFAKEHGFDRHDSDEHYFLNHYLVVHGYD
jgi:hypothetical protein